MEGTMEILGHIMRSRNADRKSERNQNHFVWNRIEELNSGPAKAE